MLPIIIISTIFVSVNCIVLPGPCTQRSVAIVVPSGPPPCAKQMPLVMPYDLPRPCGAPACAKQMPLVIPYDLPIPCGAPPCAKQTPLVMPYDLSMPCGAPIKFIEPVVNCGMAPRVCGPMAEIAMPEIMPICMGNPFLPAASPVSALAPPFYPYTPPISPCNCNCQYLKKIPIPPPCI